MDKIKPSLNRLVFYVALLAIGMGIGAGNEIAEFSAVLFIERTGVGGYYNTAWDLVFNSLGALLGVIVIAFQNRSFRRTK